MAKKGYVLLDDTGVDPTICLDEDNMVSDSATALATQQSIKAYVDTQVGTTDTLSEVLAIGNTTGANNIIVSAGQAIQTATGAGNTMLLQAYDVDGASYTTFATLTANNDPTMDLAAGVTLGGAAIAFSGGAFHDGFSDFVANEHVDHSTVSLTVSGTASRLSVTGAGGDITTSRTWTLDIDAAYVGQASITTLGTIATGTWQGTAIADGYISSAATWNAKQDALTFGIADGNVPDIDVGATIVANDYAKFTATGLIGQTYAEVKTDLSLDNVENTALSTWAGSANITTLGTITTGTWNGTAIGDGYIASAATWNAKIANVVEDTTPQLGGMLDVNGNSIGDGSLELLKFVETGSAINEFTITNAAIGTSPILSATGDDANIGMTFTPKGTGNITLGTMAFDSDQTIGAGQDNYVLTYDDGTGLISLEAAAGGASFGAVDEIPHTNATTDDFDYSANFRFDGARLHLLHNQAVRSICIGEDAGLNMNTFAEDNICIGWLAGDILVSGDRNICIGIGSDTGSSTALDAIAIGYQAEAPSYSVSIGKSAGAALTTGSNNVCIGRDCSPRIASAGNVAIGYQVLASSPADVDYMIGIGWDAAYDGGGDYSIIMGYQAGYIATGTYNFLVGYQAGYNVTGQNNIVMGTRAGDALTSSDYNVIIGYEAGSAQTTADANVFIGYEAGRGGNATNAVAIGYQAMRSALSGTDSVYIGSHAGQNATGTTEAVFIGNNSGYSSFGDYCVAIGTEAFRYSLDAADYNVAIGYQAMQTGVVNAKADGYCVAIGYQASQTDYLSSHVVAIGYQAGQANDEDDCVFIGRSSGAVNSGANNVFVGAYTGDANSSGADNTLIGDTAGSAITTGAQNTVLGSQAGSTNSTGSGNVMLGYSAGSAETGSNKLYIENSNSASPLIWGDFNTDDVKINGTFEVTEGLINNITTSAAGGYTVLVTDFVILKTGITASGDTVTLPSTAATGQRFVIKDASGNAGTDNITIATAGAENIDGAGTATINQNYGGMQVIFDGTNYFVIGLI